MNRGIVQHSGLTQKLFFVQQGQCFLCGEPMIFAAKPGTQHALHCTREHVFPRATTGHGLDHNFVLTHKGCNGKRGDREPSPIEISRAARLYSLLGLEAFIPNVGHRPVTRHAIEAWRAA